MFRPYASVLRTPGAALPLLACFLSALPISMLGLGVLLLIRSTTGSFAQAGAVSAALSIGNAVGLTVQGGLIDRRGQTRVLVASSLACLTFLVLLTIATTNHGPLLLLAVLALAAGASIPANTSSMRVLWPELVADPDVRATAYAVLSTQFVAAMITGPLLVSGLLLVAGPAVAVLVAAGLAGAAGVLFALTPASRRWRPVPAPPRTRPRPRPRGDGVLTPGLRTLLLAGLLGGAATGMENVGVPAVAVSQGAAALAGVMFAAAAAGDLLGGFVYGSRTWRMPTRRRLVVCQTVRAVGAGLLAVLSGHPLAMLPVMFGIGAVAAPASIASSTLLDDVARQGTLARSYTLMVAAGLVGIAGGSGLGGVLGSVAAPWVLFAAAAFVASGAALWTQLRRHTLRSRPTVDSSLTSEG